MKQKKTVANCPMPHSVKHVMMKIKEMHTIFFLYIFGQKSVTTGSQNYEMDNTLKIYNKKKENKNN